MNKKNTAASPRPPAPLIQFAGEKPPAPDWFANALAKRALAADAEIIFENNYVTEACKQAVSDATQDCGRDLYV